MGILISLGVALLPVLTIMVLSFLLSATLYYCSKKKINNSMLETSALSAVFFFVFIFKPYAELYKKHPLNDSVFSYILLFGSLFAVYAILRIYIFTPKSLNK